MQAVARGLIQRGIGESKNTIHAQMPFFKKCFPEVIVCEEGTINIALEKPLVVITPDFTTAPIPWHPAFKVVKGGEIIEFVRIILTVDGFKPVDAWVYRAQFSPYYNNPFYIEVLAPKIGFHGTPGCSVEIKSACKEGLIVIGDSSRQAPCKG